MRLRRWTLGLAVLAGVVLPAVAWAQVTPAGGTAAGDDTQVIRVGAVIFYDFTYQKLPKVPDAANNSVSPTSFNVARAYINITGNISHVVSFRITPDLVRDTTNVATVGSLLYRLKYGYAQFALDDWTGNWRQTYVRLGIQQTPFIDYQESVYRYRFQGTLFAERDGGLSSSDAGATFHTNLPNLYGDLHVGIYNGEGYNRAEPNNQKAFMIRGTVRPFPTGNALARGFRGTLFYIGDHVVKNAVRNRFIGSVALEQRHYNANFDYLSRTDQTLPTNPKVDSDGYSFFVTPFFKEKGNGPEALIRFDSFRSDTTNFKERRQNRFIIGAAYWFPHPGGNSTAALMLDWEQVTFEHPTPAQVKQQRLFVHGLINF